ncbi:hypothetical protein J2S54_006900 [Streptomyces sp. DSM 42143]|nr:hypothetical protein [Streptomyces sp. DSM 42143]
MNDGSEDRTDLLLPDKPRFYQQVKPLLDA